MPQASFQGLRVLALENRRAQEIARLIETYGGVPTVTPAMREVPLASNHEALHFAATLLRGEFDWVLFLTGAGIRTLMNSVETQYDREEFLAALRQVKVAARGPKPSSVLKEFQVPITAIAPEPCTWRELMESIERAAGKEMSGLRIAVQEYGAPNPELLAALKERGASVTRVPVYQWALPEDTTQLRETVRMIVERRVDVVLFMSAVQIVHLCQIAEQMRCLDGLYAGLRAMVVLSIGPSTSEELRRRGLEPDMEPSHPKMGFLVNEAAQCAAELLATKRTEPVPVQMPKPSI